jgi:hypothetical protein
MDTPQLTAALMLGADDCGPGIAIRPTSNTLTYARTEQWLQSKGLLHVLATRQGGIMIKDHAIATVMAIYEIYEDEGFQSLVFAVHTGIEITPKRTANAVIKFCKTVYAATLPTACMHTESECTVAYHRLHFQYACDWCNAQKNVPAFGGMHPWDHWAIKRFHGLPKKRANTA